METVLIVEDDRVYARATTNWLVKKRYQCPLCIIRGQCKGLFGP